MVIKIYVRLGEDRSKDTRRISFRTPLDIPSEETLEHVTAIDGQECVIEVVPDEQNIYKTLLRVEQDLLQWLRRHDYEVEFA
jgi:hypothetical protein